ncbi:hypothetical protein CRG98_037879, partial [Punica granatum]
MDGFSGYNQIRMAEEDKIETTFITMWGTFCYRVMPLGLKNAEATYQRAIITLFHDMMHKEIEVYVDDMIAKSKEGEDHLVNLKRLFDRLKKYKLKLNPTKCTFGAKSGKLLGFVVSERGIEVDPDKVKAISELRQPSTARELTEYHIEYVPRTSVKGQAIADHLAEFPIEDDTPINSDFPNEGILQVDSEENKFAWKMYFDGAVNSTGSSIGAVLISPDGRYYPIAAKVDFSCTNNVAEYEACILGLQAAIDFKIAKGPAHCDAIAVTDEQPWYEDIKYFLQTGQYPAFTNRRDRKTLRRLAAHYFLSGKTLYRRSFDATLLRCVDEVEAQPLMGEIHEGSCGPHMSGLMLAKKLMRLGYFWSTMEADCVKHVKHCHLCQ